MKLRARIARAMLPTIVLACGVTAHAQTLLSSIKGNGASWKYGKVCINVPDQNNDGIGDVLVGAPGVTGSRGEIRCVSGAYLANGSGVDTLWIHWPGANIGDQFGFSLADVGDVTGDNVHDFLVGQPGYDDTSGTTTVVDAGAIRLIDGNTHQAVSLIYGSSAGGQFGFAMAACGDINQNGTPDVAVGGPFAKTGERGDLDFIDGSTLTQSGSATWFSGYFGNTPGNHLGWAIASGFDLTGDGVQEVIVGSPGVDTGTSTIDAGQVLIYDPVHFSFKAANSSVAGEALGMSVSVGEDYDGDGVRDIVAGAPNAPNGTTFEVGRGVVLSSAKILAQTPPYEIFSFPYGTPPTPASHADPDPDFHYGAAVLASPDLNNDGVGEILVGAPDYYSVSFTGVYTFKGLVHVFSGATGTRLATITGAANERMGDALNTIEDLGGDGFREFLIGGSMSDTTVGTDSGVLKCYELFPVTPAVYCVGKVNSLGCTPAVGYSGAPSASSSSSFLVTASNFLNNKNGLLFYSHAPASLPFQGGTLCVKPPTKRTPVQDSGGSPPPNDCSGTYSIDMNARIQSGIDPTLAAGAEIYAQYWSRDPSSATQTSLSNALRFLISP